jgi:2-keto-4-pentenoate hydratase/2-oxohepta-3-ene-1,7-dioic acid hydratase in catechol pathway
MKIARFNVKAEATPFPRTGLLLAGDMMADLRPGCAKYLVEKVKEPQGREIAALRVPKTIVEMIAIGKPARDGIESAAAFLSSLLKSDPSAKGLAGEPLFSPLSACKLHAPSRPSKVISAGHRYRGSLKQAGAKTDGKAPAVRIKANSTINSPFRDIVLPPMISQLECETKLAVLIGHKCKNVPEDRAYDMIFGYMLAIDVSARDEGNFEGTPESTMFDTFLPTGPWVVTKDEIKDPMNLKIRVKINGQLRRDTSLTDMPWTIPQLVAHVSQIMKLEPGDIILTGTPKEQVSAQADALPLLLKMGDALESEIEGVGMLRNTIGNDPSK